MYPEKLEFDLDHGYFSEKEYFEGNFNYIHTYLHTDYKNVMHTHQFYEINIIVKGEGRHYIADTSMDTGVGDVFVIPPGVAHGYYSEGKMNIFHVLIKNDFLKDYAEELSQIDGFDILFNIEPQLRQSNRKSINLKAGAHIISSFEEELERMIEIEKSGRYVYLNAVAMAFICRLCEQMKTAVFDLSDGEAVKLMAFIHNNLEAKLSLKTLCDYAHMSAPTLHRRFKALTGQAPMAYVLSCRVQKAKRLAEEGQLKKTEIAHLCGFYDLAHMNKYISK